MHVSACTFYDDGGPRSIDLVCLQAIPDAEPGVIPSILEASFQSGTRTDLHPGQCERLHQDDRVGGRPGPVLRRPCLQ